MDSNNITSFLAALDSGTSSILGHIRISLPNSGSDYVLYKINSFSDQVGYSKLGVT